MKYYYEYCEKVFDRKGHMVLSLEGLRGFRSVYGFSESDANQIKAAGSSQNFGNYMQFADAMLFDMDDGERSVGKLTKYLRQNEIEYACYVSGGKGYHVEVPCVPMFSHNTAFSQLKLAENIARASGATVDMSLYRPSSLYRLEHTVHDKTGKPKTLLERAEGAVLEVDEVQRPATPNITHTEIQAFLKPFVRIATMTDEPLPGERHVLIWSLAKNFYEAGLDFDTALDVLIGLNNTWQEKKSYDEVRRSVVQAFPRT